MSPPFSQLGVNSCALSTVRFVAPVGQSDENKEEAVREAALETRSFPAFPIKLIAVRNKQQREDWHRKQARATCAVADDLRNRFPQVNVHDDTSAKKLAESSLDLTETTAGAHAGIISEPAAARSRLPQLARNQENVGQMSGDTLDSELCKRMSI